MRQKLTTALFVSLMLLGLGTTRATTFLQFQSTYLGNGWFQYQMNVMNDPFFTEADITSLVVNFPGQIDQSTSTNWNNTEINGPHSIWSFTNGIPARPYQQTFLVQSTNTSYKLATNSYLSNGAIVLLSLFLADYAPPLGPGVYSQNVVGYALMSCLVPCPPEEADNSPTNFVFTLKLLPDVNITQLIQTNGNIYGVDFTWNDESTFLLQGSTDMSHWTNVAYVWSWPPETAWTTNQSLSTYGNFFRLSLVASGHADNLPPLNSALATKTPIVTQSAAAPNTPRVTGCQFANGKVSVSVAAPAGQMVQVQAVDSHRAIQQSRQVVVQGPSAKVSFDAASLPSPVYFQASAVP